MTLPIVPPEALISIPRCGHRRPLADVELVTTAPVKDPRRHDRYRELIVRVD